MRGAHRLKKIRLIIRVEIAKGNSVVIRFKNGRDAPITLFLKKEIFHLPEELTLRTEYE